jgi:hypothetical protein
MSTGSESAENVFCTDAYMIRIHTQLINDCLPIFIHRKNDNSSEPSRDSELVFSLPSEVNHISLDIFAETLMAEGLTTDESEEVIRAIIAFLMRNAKVSAMLFLSDKMIQYYSDNL